MEKLSINDNILFKDKLPHDLHTAFQSYQVIDQNGNTQAIYISRLYIKFHQSKHYLYQHPYIRETRKIDTCLHTGNFLQQNGKQILHNGEYQSR